MPNWVIWIEMIRDCYVWSSARQDEVDTRRIKLDYEEITPCLKEVSKIWDRMLSSPLRAVEKFDLSQLQAAVKDGEFGRSISREFFMWFFYVNVSLTRDGVS